MTNRCLLVGTLLLGMTCPAVAVPLHGQSTDEQAIRTLNQRFSAAAKARDIDGMMSIYIPDESLVAFDAYTPRQYIGAKAYRKSYENFLAAFPGPLESTITDLSITVTGAVAFSHAIDRWVATDKDGQRVTVVFRITDVYRKINGKWLVIHEHLSFPVDPVTGKADYLSTP